MKRERNITWQAPQAGARNGVSMSGLQYLEAIRDGRLSHSPAGDLLGYRLAEVSHGHVAFELDPEEYHYNPFATVHGGIIATLLDSAMTSCVLSTLPKGVGCATVEIKVNFIRPLTRENGPVRCEARPVHLGKRLATAQGRLEDARGRLYAHGVSTCSIFNLTGQKP